MPLIFSEILEAYGPRSVPLKICLFSTFFGYMPTCLDFAINGFDEVVYHNNYFC